MVTLRKRARALETPANPDHGDENPSSKTTDNEKVSGYEQCREERIKENLQRMQNLGIFDLSKKLKSETRSPKRSNRKTHEKKLTPVNPQSLRRSSRLQSVTPVSYVEVTRVKAEKAPKDVNNLIREGPQPEIYTEEHDKVLGACEKSWELFKDGYGEDGKRIYDPINGKTCHQCRQKTLGHRTHCRKCNLVQGQFCGDCLYLRYGENVLEAKENPNWICPVCRGICNCSLCRLKKGWAPTGPLAKTVIDLGFKSVAHYLIQTRRSLGNSNDPDPEDLSLAKRSLPFMDKEDTFEQEIDRDKETEGNKEGELDGEKEQRSPIAKRSLPFTESEEIYEPENSTFPSSNLECEDNKENFEEKGVTSALEQCLGGTASENDPTLKMATELGSGPKSNSDSIDPMVAESEPKLHIKKSKKRPAPTPPVHDPDGIAGRLRKRPDRSV